MIAIPPLPPQLEVSNVPGVASCVSPPSITRSLPDDCDVYLVADDFGRRGHAWRELDEEQTDRETIIRD